jgi:acyl-CoA reductase-like NAD-dependent aldehyde dehydrogenase
MLPESFPDYLANRPQAANTDLAVRDKFTGQIATRVALADASDAMPYGGAQGSGLGREGVRFAIEEMTEIRMLVIRTP